MNNWILGFKKTAENLRSEDLVEFELDETGIKEIFENFEAEFEAMDLVDEKDHRNQVDKAISLLRTVMELGFDRFGYVYDLDGYAFYIHDSKSGEWVEFFDLVFGEELEVLWP